MEMINMKFKMVLNCWAKKGKVISDEVRNRNSTVLAKLYFLSCKAVKCFVCLYITFKH